MALSLTNTLGISSNPKGRPFLNSFITRNNRNGFTGIATTQKMQQKKQLVEWFKSRPELNSPVNARVNDTIKQVEFYALDGKPLGRNKRLEANKWWTDNFADERIKSMWTDAIITGEGFGWKGRLKDKQIKQTIKEMTAGMSKIKGINLKELREEIFVKAMDEDSTKVRIFDYVASSTMEIDHDEMEINGYVQNVNANTQRFTKEEIIRFPFSSINGEVNGYTPVLSLASELILIWFIKENMKSYMRNNGVPKKLFTMIDEMANSDNHKYMIEQLQNFGAVQNRHGNLVLTGKVDVADLEEKIKDMDYKELALYVTSNIAYALQIPVSRIPYMIGKAQSAGDAGGLAESGYWSMIEADQRKIENLLNTQMFEKMGWIVRFKKQHKIDDLRETQAMSMKADAITKLQSVFQTYKKKLTEQKIISLMDLNEDDVEDLSGDEMMQGAEQTRLNNQNLLNNQALAEGDKVVKADKKRTEAVNNPKNLPQNGV